MKKQTALLALIAMISFFETAPARALDISAVGGLDLYTASIDPTPTIDPSTGASYAFGALLGIGLAPMTKIETGAVFARNSIKTETTLATINQKFSQLQIPVLFRVAPIEVLSLGLGGYMGIGISDVTDTTSSNSGGASVSVTRSRDSLNFGGFDAGLAGSIALKIPVAPLLGIVVDGRYYFGLVDLDTSDTRSLKTREMQFLAGLNIGL